MGTGDELECGGTCENGIKVCMDDGSLSDCACSEE